MVSPVICSPVRGARSTAAGAACVALMLGACASSGVGARATTSSQAVLATDAARTLPSTVAPVAQMPTSTATTAAPVAPTTPPIPPSGAASASTIDVTKPDTWLVAGSVTGDDNAGMIVYSDRVSVCVGVHLPAGGTRDSCADVGTSWYAVLADPDRLYVVAAGQADGHLVVESTTGGYDVALLAAGASAPRPFGVAAMALTPGSDIVRIDGAAVTTACPYRALFAALVASGSVADGPRPMSVNQCTASAASAGLFGNSRSLQGGGALFEHGPDGQWMAVNVGGELCGNQGLLDPATLTRDQQAALERTASVCRALGR